MQGVINRYSGDIMKEKFKKVFKTDKPIIGMLHTLGGDRNAVLEIAKEEIEIMYRSGVDAVLVENYFGSTDDVEAVLNLLQTEYPNSVYGVNVLGDYEMAFELANQYGAAFVQIDSVSGHLPPSQDKIYADNLKELRSKFNVFLLGGVRFKYQPYRSGRTLEEDLKIGMDRCDAVVVTGSLSSPGGTGVATEYDKVEQYREIVGDFPLIVGAGITAETVEKLMSVADGGIVGSYFKQSGDAYNRMDSSRVSDFMKKIK